jgi:hypothetical protein
MVVHLVGVQVESGELLGDQVEQLGLVQPLDRAAKSKCSKIVAHVGREALDVAVQVGADVVLVAHQLAHVERRHVVEVQAGLALDEGLEGDAGGLLGGVLLEHLGLGRRQHAVQPAQHRERQDHPAVLDCLKSPRRRSATDQMREERACWFMKRTLTVR